MKYLRTSLFDIQTDIQIDDSNPNFQSVNKKTCPSWDNLTILFWDNIPLNLHKRSSLKTKTLYLHFHFIFFHESKNPHIQMDRWVIMVLWNNTSYFTSKTFLIDLRKFHENS